MNEFWIYTQNFLFKIPVTETAVCQRLSVAGRVYVFIAYKEGRIGAFFLIAYPIQNEFSQIYKQKTTKSFAHFFFLSVKFPIRKKDIIK